MTTSDDYIKRVIESGRDEGHALEFEGQALSIGSEFLPEHARAVRDGGEGTPEYWAWLIEQFELSGRA